MALTLGSNIASLKAQRQVSQAANELGTVQERLASGQRINRASDDAASLAIADSLRADRRVFTQGIRNFNDGLSVLSIADAATENLTNIVVRLKELAEQAANGVYSAVQRKALDKEAQALSKEYTRIIDSTTFNGKQILKASYGSLNLQGGIGNNSIISSDLGGKTGTGSFNGVISFTSLGTTTHDTQLGDLNGDGFLDLVSAQQGGASGLSVRLGNGSGSFGAETTYAGIAVDLLLRDLNNDGHLDIVSNFTTQMVRLGNGDGTFGSIATYTPGTVMGTATLMIGDVTGDGIVDMIVAGSTDMAYNSILSIRAGAGNGTFGAETTYLMSADSIMNASALSDINNDGILDVIVNNELNMDGTLSYSVGLGNGSGSFSFSSFTSRVPIDLRASSISVGDINGDGKMDLAISGIDAVNGFYSNNLMVVLTGRGDGTFNTGTTLMMIAGPHSAGDGDLADLNGDGNLDLISTGTLQSGGIFFSTRLGTGSGTFAAATTIAPYTANSRSITLGDINSDGAMDFLASGTNGGTARMFIGLNNTVTGTSALLPFELTDIASSRRALSIFSQKITQLGAQRGQIGAFQARVQVGINNLQAVSENYAAAESRIRDVDVAEEAANLVRLSILQKAGVSVLAQANQQTALVLKLLE